MDTNKFDDGIEITVPNGFTIVENNEMNIKRSKKIKTSGVIEMPLDIGSGNNNENVIDALEKAGFEIVREQLIQPESQIKRNTRNDFTNGGTAEFKVNLKQKEGAVILFEQDGMYLWKYASHTISKSSVKGRGSAVNADKQLVFQVEIESQNIHRRDKARRDIIGKVKEFTWGKIKAYILKFVASATVEIARNHLEKNISRGLIHIDSTIPEDWQMLSNIDNLDLPSERAPKILLFVHGTFSSTLGAFGSLGATPWGKSFLHSAFRSYDAVIGFNHATLGEDPLQNARQLLNILKSKEWRVMPQMDVVVYSRGGLVIRCLIEKLLPQINFQLTFNRVIFVASTNAGTILAKPQNWENLVNLYTNLAAGTCRVIGLIAPQAKVMTLVLEEAIQSIGSFVKFCANSVITDKLVPGLAAMEPDGAFIKDISLIQEGQPDANQISYCAITSEFNPQLTGKHEPKELPLRFLSLLGGRFIGHLMNEANDLVVNTESMAAIDLNFGNFVKKRYDFGKNPQVYHTNYFTRPEVVNAISGWLNLPILQPEKLAEVITSRQSTKAIFDEKFELPDNVQKLVTIARNLYNSSKNEKRINYTSPNIEEDLEIEGDTWEFNEVPHMPAIKVKCYFKAEMDSEVLVNKEAIVFLTISRELLNGINSEVSTTADGFFELNKKIVVRVIARSNFIFVDGNDGRAEIDVPDINEQKEITFKVLATELEGEGEIWVLIRQEQISVAKLVLKPRVVKTLSSGLKMISSDRTTTDPKPLTKPLHQLWIEERKTEEGFVYIYDIYSEGLKIKGHFKSHPIKGDREKYVDNLYKQIEERWLSSGKDEENFAEEIRAFGADLFDELIPKDLQKVLWKRRNDFDSIQVESSEPFIPWELLHLRDPENKGMPSETIFLAQMGLIRWLQGAGKDGWPPEEIKIRKGRINYVIPNYPHPDYKLPEAEEEAKFLKDEFSAEEITPDSGVVRRLISQPGKFDLLHFACHGLADSSMINEAILLMQGRVEVNNYLIDSFSATTAAKFSNLNTDNNEPMIVLNACQVGRAGNKLTGIGGFANAFLMGGAGAFIGTLWSVGDRPARTYTETMYKALLDGRTLSEATVEARIASKDAGEATWLAYVVYGHPHLRIVK